MRLVTYRLREETSEHVGMVEDDRVVPFSVDGGGPRTMLEVIAAGSGGALPDRPNGQDSVPLDEVVLLAPIPRPAQNIICLGRNYADHADEMARALQDVTSPTFFTKAITTVVGPTDDIPFDDGLSSELDWEVELACIVGRTARRVASTDAFAHIFGYMVLNDVSARDLQYGHGGQFFYGKSLEGSCPIGPWIVTADEVPNPHDLPIRLRLNGEVKQDSNTGRMIFDIRHIVETLSRAMTLLPGQIIATGTPSGVGYARSPKEFLKPGDVMESEIDGIGTLRNSVRQVSLVSAGR